MAFINFFLVTITGFTQNQRSAHKVMDLVFSAGIYGPKAKHADYKCEG